MALLLPLHTAARQKTPTLFEVLTFPFWRTFRGSSSPPPFSPGEIPLSLRPLVLWALKLHLWFTREGSSGISSWTVRKGKMTTKPPEGGGFLAEASCLVGVERSSLPFHSPACAFRLRYNFTTSTSSNFSEKRWRKPLLQAQDHLFPGVANPQWRRRNTGDESP